MDTNVINLRPDPAYPDAKSRNSFQDGLEFQDFACHALTSRVGLIIQNFSSRKWQFNVGENIQGIEIKQDQRCLETGRLSIEVAERSQNNPAIAWTPSGIRRQDNAWLYVQGNYQVIFIFAKNWLNRYYEEKRPEIFESRGTIRKFYLPISTAKICAAKVLLIESERDFI